MRIHFKKGYNKDKPNRWYIFGSCTSQQWNSLSTGIYNISIEGYMSSYPEHHLTFGDWFNCHKVRAKLLELGIKTHELQRWTSDPRELFVYFRCHADEAEFMLKFSDGVEIEL